MRLRIFLILTEWVGIGEAAELRLLKEEIR